MTCRINSCLYEHHLQPPLYPLSEESEGSACLVNKFFLMGPEYRPLTFGSLCPRLLGGCLTRIWRPKLLFELFRHLQNGHVILYCQDGLGPSGGCCRLWKGGHVWRHTMRNVLAYATCRPEWLSSTRCVSGGWSQHADLNVFPSSCYMSGGCSQ